MKNLKKFFQSNKNHPKIFWGIGGFIFILIVFQAGVFVGYHKAAYSYRLGEKYYSMFGEHERGHVMGFKHNDFLNTHGAIGKIISIALPNIIIEDRDGIEKNVVLEDDTMIKRFRDKVTPSDLKIGDSVVIIGMPNDQAQIEARLVRIMPLMPIQTITGTTTKQ